MCARATIGYDAVENFSRNLKPGSSFATSGGFCLLNAESPNILKYFLQPQCGERTLLLLLQIQNENAPSTLAGDKYRPKKIKSKIISMKTAVKPNLLLRGG